MCIYSMIKRAKLNNLLETSDREVISDEYIAQIAEAFAALFLPSSEHVFLISAVGEELMVIADRLQRDNLISISQEPQRTTALP